MNQTGQSAAGPERGFSFSASVQSGEEANSDKRELGKLYKAIARDVLAFNNWLTSKNPDNFCLDMDLSSRTTYTTIIDEQEAISRFTQHIESIRKLGEDRTELLELVHDRLIAQVVFRQELAKVKAGEPKTPYDEYLRAINGFGEKDVDRDFLEEKRQEVIGHAIRVTHVRSDINAEEFREDLLSYNRNNLLHTPKDVEAHYWRYAHRFRSDFARVLGVDLSKVNYQFLRKYRKEFWKFFERPGKTDSSLWINWHERHREEYNIALVEAYVPHEESHFDVGEIIRQEIASGNLDALAGLITIPGPDSYYLEGLALTAHDWADFDLTDDGNLGASVYKLEKIALVKGFYLVEHGMPVEKATKEIARYIPMKTLDQIEKLLEEGTTDPWARAYQVVYGRAVMDFDEISKNLSDENKVVFIREIAKRPRTRNQIRNLLSDMLVA